MYIKVTNKDTKQQLQELKANSKAVMINGKRVLIVPKGLSVTNKLFTN